jgi:hypothetical protein
MLYQQEPLSRCKFCGLENNQLVKECTNGEWATIDSINAHVAAAMENDVESNNSRCMDQVHDTFPGYPNELTSVRVLLTIKRLDRDEESSDVNKLLCQRCHLQEDARRERVRTYESSMFPI